MRDGLFILRIYEMKLGFHFEYLISEMNGDSLVYEKILPLIFVFYIYSHRM